MTTTFETLEKPSSPEMGALDSENQLDDWLQAELEIDNEYFLSVAVSRYGGPPDQVTREVLGE